MLKNLVDPATVEESKIRKPNEECHRSSKYLGHNKSYFLG